MVQTQQNKILESVGWQAAVGFRFLKDQTDAAHIELVGRVELKSQAETVPSFLYFATAEKKPMLYLFTVPAKIADGPLKVYKFKLTNICELEQFLTFTTFGIEPKIAFGGRTSRRYNYAYDKISESHSGKIDKTIPRPEFLSAHAEIYTAMRQTIHGATHRLITQLPAGAYAWIMRSLNTTLKEIERPETITVKPAAESKPVTSPKASSAPNRANGKSVAIKPIIHSRKVISELKRPRPPLVRQRSNIFETTYDVDEKSIFAQPIIPPKTALKFVDMGFNDVDKSRWIRFEYPGCRLKVHFEDDGRVTEIYKRIPPTKEGAASGEADSWQQFFHIGRRFGLTLEIGAYSSSGRNELVKLPLKKFATFMEPLIEQIAAYTAMTRMPDDTRQALENLVAKTRALGSIEVSARKRG